jgi:protein-S-isoprenylcysteine O-methyltransferase Ste14
MSDIFSVQWDLIIPIMLFGLVITRVNRRLKLGNKIFPPEYLLMFVFAQSILHFYMPLTQLLQFPITLLGLIPVALRYGTRYYFHNVFDKHATTISPLEESSHLFTGGVFRYSRNPIYVIMTFFLIGTAILFGSLSALLIVIFYPLLINYRFIRFEEAILEKTFGDGYRQYKSRVRRWI